MTDPDSSPELPPAQDKADILFFPPYLSIAAPLLAIALEFVAPLGLLPGWSNPLTFLTGLALLCLAGWLEVTATRSFAAAQTNVNPRRPALTVVRKGPYRFTRNPMYLGMVMIMLGVAISFGTAPFFAAAALLFAILNFAFCRFEEERLRAAFPGYATYAARVRRWI